jgi:hypothetical protein
MTFNLFDMVKVKNDEFIGKANFGYVTGYLPSEPGRGEFYSVTFVVPNCPEVSVTINVKSHELELV